MREETCIASRDLDTTLFPSLCSRIFLPTWCSQSSWIFCPAKRAEMVNIEQTKKIVPLITCEISFGQNLCELMFGANVTDFDFGVQIDSVKQPIQSNSVGPWNMPHCGTSTFDDHFDYLSSKTNNIALEPECIVLDGMWSMFLEWRWCAWLDGVVHGWLNNCWRVSPQLPLASICVVRFGMNTSITNSQRPRAGITSMHTPASRETIAASIELCETEVCFFAHPTYCCKTCDLRRCTEFLLMLILNLQGFLQNQSLETMLFCIVVLCFPHNNMVGTHLCDECTRSKRTNCLSQAYVHFVTARASLFTRPLKYQVSQCQPYTDILRTICEQTIDNWPKDPLIFFSKMMVIDACCCDFV